MYALKRRVNFVSNVIVSVKEIFYAFIHQTNSLTSFVRTAMLHSVMHFMWLARQHYGFSVKA